MVVDDSINNMAFLMPRVVTPAEVTQDANLHVSVQELPKKKKNPVKFIQTSITWVIDKDMKESGAQADGMMSSQAS